jgi:hypothetical protein
MAVALRGSGTKMRTGDFEESRALRLLALKRIEVPENGTLRHSWRNASYGSSAWRARLLLVFIDSDSFFA